MIPHTARRRVEAEARAFCRGVRAVMPVCAAVVPAVWDGEAGCGATGARTFPLAVRFRYLSVRKGASSSGITGMRYTTKGRCQSRPEIHPTSSVQNISEKLAIPDLIPICCIRCGPEKKSAITPAASGITRPHPTPMKQLIMISETMERARKQAMPLSRNMAMPRYIRPIFERLMESFPESRMKGMMTKLGSTDSSCISRCVACGNMMSRLLITGVMASPGRSTTREMDQMAMRVSRDMEPLPV